MFHQYISDQYTDSQCFWSTLAASSTEPAAGRRKKYRRRTRKLPAETQSLPLALGQGAWATHPTNDQKISSRVNAEEPQNYTERKVSKYRKIVNISFKWKKCDKKL